MISEIVVVGTEFLLGQSVDTDSSYIAGRLAPLGIDLYFVSVVGDNRRRLVEAIQRALARSDLVVTTGGLGPTDDDITREAIAEAMGEALVLDPQLEAWMRDVFARRGRQMPSRFLMQAMTIPSATTIHSPLGEAPGWWVEKEDRVLVALPGPPAELIPMWQEKVEPRLRQRAPAAVITSRTLKTLGIDEASVNEMLGPLLASTNPTIGIYAKADGVQIRLTAKAPAEAQAREMLASLEAQVRHILGDVVWGIDEDTLAGVVGALLKERGLTLAVIESCTGGLLSNTITNVAGSSAYFKGGVVAYDPAVKVALGVEARLIEEHGVVSEEVAVAMARAIRERLDADFGLSTTGVAGPDSLEGKPVGTIYIALADAEGVRVAHRVFGQRRLEVKRWAMLYSLMMLREALLGG